MQIVEAEVKAELERRGKAFAQRIRDEQKFFTAIMESFKRVGADLEAATSDYRAALKRDSERSLEERRETPQKSRGISP